MHLLDEAEGTLKGDPRTEDPQRGTELLVCTSSYPRVALSVDRVGKGSQQAAQRRPPLGQLEAMEVGTPGPPTPPSRLSLDTRRRRRPRLLAQSRPAHDSSTPALASARPSAMGVCVSCCRGSSPPSTPSAAPVLTGLSPLLPLHSPLHTIPHRATTRPARPRHSSQTRPPIPRPPPSCPPFLSPSAYPCTAMRCISVHPVPLVPSLRVASTDPDTNQPFVASIRQQRIGRVRAFAPRE